jgi:small subunit ribosomal protein S1
VSDTISDKIDAGMSTSENNVTFYEKAIKEPQVGEIIKGKVICIAKDVIMVDIGYKAEGHISLKEFLDSNGNIQVNVGDEIEALLENAEDENGCMVLSKEKARQIIAWREVEEAYGAGRGVEGRITHKIKAGFSVDLKGLTAFLPGSQADIRPINPDQLVNNSFMFKVLQYDRQKPNIVVSRRAILEEERERTKEDTAHTIDILEEGSIVDGVVKNIVNYGVFVDLGGIDGLLHITDMSWGKIRHPSDLFHIGDKISVKIIKFNKEENKVSLGLKQIKPNPWDTAKERYHAGAKIIGKVSSIADYGVFVEIEEGLEGLVHLSELNWTKTKHPSQTFKIGDTLEVKILEIDHTNRKMFLSRKQVEPSLWDELSLKYPKGARVKGLVKNIADYGVFLSIEEGVDGLVHISDMSWNKIKHPSELFRKGQEIEAEILNVDKDKERLSLSIKAVRKDPWREIEGRYRAGISVSGRVTNIAHFGAFVELEDGVEGLIHVSELVRGKRKGLEIMVGDKVEAEVLNVDSDERKIGLGLKGLVKEEERTAI